MLQHKIGLSPGFYAYSLNLTEVAYGCWFNMLDNDDDKSANIYINTGKTLILPPITDWYLFTSIFHEMFHEIDSETGKVILLILLDDSDDNFAK